MKDHVFSGFRFYSERRAGPPGAPVVVWIGGAMMPFSAMDKYLTWFSGWCDVIAVDLPGTGLADFLPYEFDSLFLADCLARALDDHSVKKVSLCSTSYGGVTAMAFSKAYPERVGRLVAISTCHELSAGLAPIFEGIIDAALDRNLSGMAEIFSNRVFNDDKAALIPRAKAMKRALRRTLSRASLEDISSFAANTKRLMVHDLDLSGRVDVPALFFTGEFDQFTTPEMVERTASHFNGSRITMINRADHMLHVEQPDIIQPIIREFLEVGQIRPHWPGQALASD